MNNHPIYVASRASIPERAALWREFRAKGYLITSTWIDEDGPGQTQDYAELWTRIKKEIDESHKLVLYAQKDDFPLKGAILEAGMAIGMGLPVIVCLPGVELQGRTLRPIGSWIMHPQVKRIDDIEEAMDK